MTLIYVITRILTIPGAFSRSLWELLVCRVCSVAVYDNRAFKFSALCGHIEHESLNENPWKSFFVCSFPFIMNLIIGNYFLCGSAYQLLYIGDTKNILSYLFLWFGISLVANCAPSFADMIAFKDSVYGGKKVFFKIIFAPFFALNCVTACLEKYSLTFLLAVAYGVCLPYIFGWLLPVLSAFQTIF